MSGVGGVQLPDGAADKNSSMHGGDHFAKDNGNRSPDEMMHGEPSMVFPVRSRTLIYCKNFIDTGTGWVHVLRIRTVRKASWQKPKLALCAMVFVTRVPVVFIAISSCQQLHMNV